MSNKKEIVPLMLNGGQVTRGFRDALWEAAGREGISVNEFVLLATGDRLKRMGKRFPSVFFDEDRT